MKKNNSKTVWLLVEDRISEIGIIQQKLEGVECYHDPNAYGSSIGALIVNGIKVYLKELGRKDVMHQENLAIRLLQQEIDRARSQSGKDYTIILENGTELKNPILVRKTNGTPKSDFYIENNSGDSIHISHKKGTKPYHFQQWSGMAEEGIANHHYCQHFQQEMQRRYTELQPTQAIAMKIPNDDGGTELKTMACYGVDSYTSVKNGVNKVDCLIQGSPKLERMESGAFKIASDSHRVYTFPQLPVGGYEPVLSLVYKGDRSNYGIKGARASIYPLEGRPFKEIIKAQ